MILVHKDIAIKNCIKFSSKDGFLTKKAVMDGPSYINKVLKDKYTVNNKKVNS